MRGNNLWILFLFVLMCPAVWYFGVFFGYFSSFHAIQNGLPSLFSISLLSSQGWKSEWSKIGDGNSHQLWQRLGRNQYKEACLNRRELPRRWTQCSRHPSTCLDACMFPHACLQIIFTIKPANCKWSLKPAYCDLWLRSLPLSLSLSLYFFMEIKEPFEKVCSLGVRILSLPEWNTDHFSVSRKLQANFLLSPHCKL